MILALCTSAIAFAPPPSRVPRLAPLAYGRRGDADHDRWQSTADELTKWRGDEATVSKFWRIDCDDDGFTWERRWPRREPVVEDVSWDRITRVCWECGEWLMMDNFYLIADHDDREWVVPSAALGHGRLVDVLDRKGIFPTKTYVACQCVSERRYDLRGECQRQGAEREPLGRRRAEGRLQEAARGGASRAGRRNRRETYVTAPLVASLPRISLPRPR